MDAAKFVKESRRMCKYYKHCAGCIAYVNDDCAFDMSAAPMGTEDVVALVEQWTKEHPLKTRQSEFLKQWPNARIDGKGVVAIMPCRMNAKEFCTENGTCGRNGVHCDDCCREFWMQEVE